MLTPSVPERPREDFEFRREPGHTAQLQWLLSSPKYSTAAAGAILQERVIDVKRVALECCLLDNETRRPDLRFDAKTEDGWCAVAVETKVDSEWTVEQLLGEAGNSRHDVVEKGVLLAVGTTSFTASALDLPDELRSRWRAVNLKGWIDILESIGVGAPSRISSDYVQRLRSEMARHRIATEWSRGHHGSRFEIGPDDSPWLPAKAWFGALLDELGPVRRSGWQVVHLKRRTKRKALVSRFLGGRRAFIEVAFGAGETKKGRATPLDFRIILQGGPKRQAQTYPLAQSVCSRYGIECSPPGSAGRPKTICRAELGDRTPKEALAFGLRILRDLKEAGAMAS